MLVLAPRQGVCCAAGQGRPTRNSAALGGILAGGPHHDLDLPVRIVGAPTQRERDRLAMSSRNAYLSQSERASAPTLHRVLKQCAEAIAGGGAIETALAQGRREIERAGFALDYLEARHAQTLAPVRTRKDGPIRLLIAARIGRTRLIDNMAA